jgi:type IV pilus biogenesis protein PilP
MADKSKATSSTDTRKKITIGITAVVVLIVIWQIMGLFGGGSSPAPASTPEAAKNAPPPMPTPTPATLAATQQQPMTQREAELMRLQQETEAKYISALNQLQMLQVEKDIADTNKDIAKAKLDTVTAQKGIVDALSVPAQPPGGAFVQGLSGTQQTTTTTTETKPVINEVTYTVVSVSQLRYRWSAVMSYMNALYSVSVGDILPPDGSKVISIDKSGVTLEKDGGKKKVSMVPII